VAKTKAEGSIANGDHSCIRGKKKPPYFGSAQQAGGKKKEPRMNQ